MFSELKQNSLFYILDKNNEPTLKIGKVADNRGIDYRNPMMQTVKVVVNTQDGVIEFDQLPANLSSATDEKLNVVVSDNQKDMCVEVEKLLALSQQYIAGVSYHEAAIPKYEEMLIKLNPKIAKEKEQEGKINALETKVTGIESNINDIKAMMSQLLNK